MEVTRQQDKPLSLLEKARQELAAFNQKERSVTKLAAAFDARMNRPEQSHGERILYCSKMPQASAVLIMKLHEKGAEITDVIMRRKAPVPASASAPDRVQVTRNDLDSRALLLGNYQGCPHCGNRTLVMCGDCGSLTCMAAGDDISVCAVCASQGRVVRSGISLEFSPQKSAQQASAQALLPMGERPLSLPRKS